VAIALEAGGARLVIEPENGSAVTRYAWREREVLRPALRGAARPIERSCFPLVPFANRIAYGKFRWRGREITLHPNFGDDPHAIHGQGWQSTWRIAEQSDARAQMAFDHAAGEWPWAYRAELNYSLDGDGALHATLSVTNHGDGAMPTSLGFHPYFPKYRPSRLTAAVDGMWLTDKTLLPATLGAPILDFANGAALEGAPFIDNCFTGWAGRAAIDQPDSQIVLQAGTRFVQIFVPEGMDFFCVEPATAMPDSVNRAQPTRETGLLALPSGATYTVSMTIRPQERTS